MDPGERQELMRSLLERFEALQQSEGSDAAATTSWTATIAGLIRVCLFYLGHCVITRCLNGSCHIGSGFL